VTPLPGALGGSELVAWRLDRAVHASTWNSGKGAFIDGGRWNSPGRRIVYCALDPATSILEVAVHKGFDQLDTVRHVMTSLTINDPSTVRVVMAKEIPNPNWLRPGAISAGQQAFGDALTSAHDFVVLPSVVSTKSWNLVFDADRATATHRLREQALFALDPRLSLPVRFTVRRS
jgi:RES domain-containing protein